MSRKVGRLTLAAALILAGFVVLIDNLVGTGLAWYIGRLWPLLIILLGLEWLWASARLQPGDKVVPDGGAIAGVLIVAVVAGSVSAAWRAWPEVRFNREFHVNVSPTVPNVFGSVSGEATMEQPLDVTQIKELALKSSSAGIVVQDGTEAKAVLWVRTWAGSREQAEELARSFTMDIDRGARTAVELSSPSHVNRYDATLTVTLPRDRALDLTVESSSGSVNVSDRTGRVNLETSSGSARVSGVKGNVDIRSISGSIHAERIEGDLAATASSGSIRLQSVMGRVKAGSTSGSISVLEPGGAVSAQASSGSVTVDATEVKGNYDLVASSGSVRLSMPSSASVTVTARASSGTVSGPPWLTLGEGRNSGSGSHNGGSVPVNIRTSSGSIRIEER